MAQLAQLPDDLVFYTQITMEAAEDPEFLDAMQRAHIRGALVGVESVTAEGLKDVYKGFNLAGDALVARLRAFRRHGVHVLGSFIFGLPSDDARHVRRDGRAGGRGRPHVRAVRAADAVSRARSTSRSGRPKTRTARGRTSTACRHAALADSASSERPKLYIAASDDVARGDPRRHAGRLGSLLQLAAASGRGRSVVESHARRALAFVLVSKLYRQMYANTGIATDSARVARSKRWARWLGLAVRRLFLATPMPELQMPEAPPRPIMSESARA